MPAQSRSKNSLSYTLHKLLVGLLLRCPNCEKGAIFSGLFTMNETCSHCGVRFERQHGESVGGMYINLIAAELITAAGFLITQLLLNPPLYGQLAFWVIFNILFVVIFYRNSRAIWVAITYLTNGLQTDAEYAQKQQEK
ncbi:MAG: DUF983 domain-containing protein [Anaerolineae bacterium]|nr:DUF983 domain-containing protein [Anaerolineae bacterium]